EGATHVNKPPIFAKAAFTLAETLITLGIIGIVAAMTIPNLIAAHQKKVTVTKLQKAISVLNQAYRLAYDDVGEVSPDEALALGPEPYFSQYWAPYLKTAHICKTYVDCGYKKDRPFTSMDNISSNTILVKSQVRVCFYTSDGFMYIILLLTGGNTTAISTEPRILVDINGGKGPNIYGKDVFFLVRTIDDSKGGAIVPYGYNLTNDEIDSNCSKSATGDFCSEKIRRAGWQIDKSYPW
ncbi:MAG: type II secretion system GspH family protein, partial [Muribaculaceae bacterium]|nr:type II secretion system GspH family protein [Muribaculaceae bacterium]